MPNPARSPQKGPKKPPYPFIAGVITAFIAAPSSVFVFLAIVRWRSYVPHHSVEACLEKYQREITFSWKGEDSFNIDLEGFQSEFLFSDDTFLQIDVGYGGDRVRHCSDRARGIRVMRQYYGPGQYLDFDRPELVGVLGDRKLETMDDMLANLDWLIPWIDSNPNALQDPEDIEDLNRYINLIIKKRLINE